MVRKYAVVAALSVLVLTLALGLRPKYLAAQTPVPTATPATNMCAPAQHSGGQTITVLNLQFTLPAPGDYSSSFARLSSGETIVRICFVQGNSAVVFNQDGSERNRQVNDASAATVLNEIARSVRVQSGTAVTPTAVITPAQPSATSTTPSTTPPPTTAPPVLIPPNTGSGGLLPK